MDRPSEGDASAAAEDASAQSDALLLFGHDIRAAISDIIGGLRLIEPAYLDPATRLQFERVQAAGDTLATLMEAALIEATGGGALTEPDASVSLSTLFGGWSRRWGGRATELGVRFDIVAEADLPDLQGVSRMALERIVGNLLSNAMIHAGGAPVRLTLRQSADGGLEFAVADGGPGFDPAQVSARPGRAGHGYGLRIARDLSGQIGGKITVARGGPFGGTVATLFLPPERVGTAAVGAMPPPAPVDLGGLRILVAEDNQTNRLILEGMLAQLGAWAEFAHDGAEALARIDAAAQAGSFFDLALIDIEMPRVSGLEVMRALRGRSDAVASMPIVALTAYVLRDNREAIYAAGADGIIGKPIASSDGFGRTVLRYVGRPAGLPEPEDVLRMEDGDGRLGRAFDQGSLDRLLDIAGPAGARELLLRLDEDLRAIRARLADGVRDGSVPVVREQTHILVALAGSVGAERLCRLSEVLNIAAKRGRTGDLAALHAPCARDLDMLIGKVAERLERMG